MQLDLLSALVGFIAGVAAVTALVSWLYNNKPVEPMPLPFDYESVRKISRN